MDLQLINPIEISEADFRSTLIILVPLAGVLGSFVPYLMPESFLPVMFQLSRPLSLISVIVVGRRG